MTRATRNASAWPPLSCDPSDPRQLDIFPGDVDNIREIGLRIDSWIRDACGHARDRIIAVNAELRAHYHPDVDRDQCSEDLLLRIWRDLPDAVPIPPEGRPAAA